MKLDFNCLKCGCSEYEVKNVYMPEKNRNIVGMDIGLYYFKICLECGYVEIYSAKVIDKNEKLNFCVSEAPV